MLPTYFWRIVSVLRYSFTCLNSLWNKEHLVLVTPRIISRACGEGGQQIKVWEGVVFISFFWLESRPLVSWVGVFTLFSDNSVEIYMISNDKVLRLSSKLWRIGVTTQHSSTAPHWKPYTVLWVCYSQGTMMSQRMLCATHIFLI